MLHRAPRLPDFAVPSRGECNRAWKRWFLSHHLFVPMLALTGLCLERTASAIAAERAEEASSWLNSAARMRRGCGALFLYGVDFEPCAPIYCGHIRSQMPPAFSGYQTRERQNAFLPGLTAFRSASLLPSMNIVCAQLRDCWSQADSRYHNLHNQCMLRAVPARPVGACPHHVADVAEPESLRAAYRREYGVVPPTDETAFAQFDGWFGIGRRETLTWFDYSAQIVRIIREVTADLEAGHRLRKDVTDDLFDSMKEILSLFDRPRAAQAAAAAEPS